MNRTIIYILGIFIFLFPTSLWASPYPACDVRPVLPSKPIAAYDYTRYISMDSDLVIRLSGNFGSMYYYFPDKTTDASTKSTPIDSPYQYLGGNGALLLAICSAHFCVGLDQSFGAVYPYSGASAHSYGTTHFIVGARFLTGDRSIITASIGGGAIYSLKNNDDINNKIFVNTNYGISVKIDLDWTLYVIPDLGIGLHISPGIAFPNFDSKFWLLEGGLHLTAKY